MSAVCVVFVCGSLENPICVLVKIKRAVAAERCVASVLRKRRGVGRRVGRTAVFMYVRSSGEKVPLEARGFGGLSS